MIRCATLNVFSHQRQGDPLALPAGGAPAWSATSSAEDWTTHRSWRRRNVLRRRAWGPWPFWCRWANRDSPSVCAGALLSPSTSRCGAAAGWTDWVHELRSAADGERRRIDGSRLPASAYEDGTLFQVVW